MEVAVRVKRLSNPVPRMRAVYHLVLNERGASEIALILICSLLLGIVLGLWLPPALLLGLAITMIAVMLALINARVRP